MKRVRLQSTDREEKHISLEVVFTKVFEDAFATEFKKKIHQIGISKYMYSPLSSKDLTYVLVAVTDNGQNVLVATKKSSLKRFSCVLTSTKHSVYKFAETFSQIRKNGAILKLLHISGL